MTWDTNREKNKKKLQKFDLSYFIGKSYFEDDGSQNYLTFQHVDSTKKDILVLEEKPTDGLDNTAIADATIVQWNYQFFVC